MGYSVKNSRLKIFAVVTLLAFFAVLFFLVQPQSTIKNSSYDSVLPKAPVTDNNSEVHSIDGLMNLVMKKS